MMKYLCVVLFYLAAANSEYLYGGDLPHNYHNAYASAYDNYKPRDYKFEYGVSDPHTGDHKSQWEVRENGVVRGAYSLLEPDGTTRIVEYYADDTGFHADVKKIGESVHAQPQHVYASTPILKTIADNIAYNGYGHGGLTHGYGAPIAAVQHVAQLAPVHNYEAPIHSIAPIAKVEHIAPVQQLITPSIHQHEEYPQHLSLEKYAHTLEPIAHSLPYNNYYPKIEQYSPIAPAYYEHISKEAPYYQQSPIFPQEHKQIYNYEPQIVKSAPTYNYEPQIFKSVPTYNYEPQIVKSAPSYSYEPQIIKASPIYVQKANIAPAHISNHGQSISYAQVNQYHDYPEQVVHVGTAHKAQVYNGGYSNYDDLKYFSQPAKAEIVAAPHNLAYAHQHQPYPYAGYEHQY